MTGWAADDWAELERESQRETRFAGREKGTWRNDRVMEMAVTSFGDRSSRRCRLRCRRDLHIQTASMRAMAFVACQRGCLWGTWSVFLDVVRQCKKQAGKACFRTAVFWGAKG